ncbi:MAG: Uma2 family endonuclease [Gammaproteobacteria bacterium]|nr:Uma2 family endonuclease [Gammaproteobacteria bacterium]
MERESERTADACIPILESGDRLTRCEFERRYAACPEIKKAELIEGVVYVSLPVRTNVHGDPHAALQGLLFLYAARTPRVRVGDNATVRLDLDNEPQPDTHLRIDEEAGGNSAIREDDYLEGAPELVAEVAASSASIDLHAKRNAYRRNGVQEYIVWRTIDSRIDWWELVDGDYVPLPTNGAGVIESNVFPGLHLATQALLVGDLPAAVGVVEDGLRSSAHKAFCELIDLPE